MKFPQITFMNHGRVVTALLICFSILSSASFAQIRRSVVKSENFVVKGLEINQLASVPGILGTDLLGNNSAGNNPTCEDLNHNFQNDPRLTYIDSHFGFKIDRGTGPESTNQIGAFSPYTVQDDAAKRTEMTGGAGPRLGNQVEVIVNNASSINVNADFALSAIIVKGGNAGANVYLYDPPTLGDTMLSPPSGGVSHIEVCFDDLSPTAADGSISGRVLTAEGRAVAGARVIVTNAFTGEVKMARTSTFGYYTVEGLETGAFYNVTVSAKRYRFTEWSKSFTLNDSLFDVDFVTTR